MIHCPYCDRDIETVDDSKLINEGRTEVVSFIMGEIYPMLEINRIPLDAMDKFNMKLREWELSKLASIL